ncbi:MAG: hypothetical protein ACO3NE_05605, partial [Alphaproteobacteria bacterium]
VLLRRHVRQEVTQVGAVVERSGLAQRIDNHPAERNPATAHMFIINPLHAHRHDNLFATHPKTSNRVAALEKLAGHGSGGAAVRSPVPGVSSRTRGDHGPWGQ